MPHQPSFLPLSSPLSPLARPQADEQQPLHALAVSEARSRFPDDNRYELSQPPAEKEEEEGGGEGEEEDRDEEKVPSAPVNDELPSPSTLPSAPPNFSPYFTLVANASITHHPTVHYIFADDPSDNDPITTAALDLLNPSSPTGLEQDGSTTRKERYALLDLDSSGTKVLNSQSMSPDWAVIGADVGAAPTWEGGADTQEGEGRGMMLKIEGMDAAAEAEQKQGGRDKELEELVKDYERRMEELRRVVGTGFGDGIGEVEGKNE